MAAASCPSGWERELEARQDPWAAPSGDGSGSESEFEFDHEDVTPAQAVELLAEYIIDLKLRGVLSATQACVLCHWAKKAGLEGTVALLAMPPLPQRATAAERKKDQTGAFSRKFDQVTGIMEEADDFYLMRTPCSFRSEGVRSNSEIVVWPPLEALAEEIDANSEMADELQKFIEGGECRLVTSTILSFGRPPAWNLCMCMRSTWMVPLGVGWMVPWGSG